MGTDARLPAERRTGRATAPGTCGELVQGVLASGDHFHGTCPIERGPTVALQARSARQNLVTGLAGGQAKLAQALLRTARVLGTGPLAITMATRSELYVGKVMGSSTADIVAGARALAAAHGASCPRRSSLGSRRRSSRPTGRCIRASSPSVARPASWCEPSPGTRASPRSSCCRRRASRPAPLRPGGQRLGSAQSARRPDPALRSARRPTSPPRRRQRRRRPHGHPRRPSLPLRRRRGRVRGRRPRPSAAGHLRSLPLGGALVELAVTAAHPLPTPSLPGPAVPPRPAG